MIQSNRGGGKGSERPELVLGNKLIVPTIHKNLK